MERENNDNPDSPNMQSCSQLACSVGLFRRHEQKEDGSRRNSLGSVVWRKLAGRGKIRGNGVKSVALVVRPDVGQIKKCGGRASDWRKVFVFARREHITIEPISIRAITPFLRPSPDNFYGIFLIGCFSTPIP
jgi:hypothetical protein